MQTLETLKESEQLDAAVRLSRPQVAVVGLGGAGCNIVTWLKERGVAGAKILGVNTDAQHLSITKADKRILMGDKLCKGLGCGGYPEKGADAAKESLDTIIQELRGANLVFIAAGLGGGTGTGAAWVVAEALKESGALSLAVVTLPFSVERARIDKAREGIEHLRECCDTVLAIDNNRLRKVAGNLPLRQAFAVANELIGSFVKNITETITTPSLVNLDFADLKTIMERGGISAIGVGEADGDARIEQAVKHALDAQLLDITDISKASGVLVHVAGGEDMTLEEVTKAGELVTQALPETVKIAWGARVDESMTGHARVMVALTGVECSFINPPKPPVRKKGFFKFI